MSRGSQENAPRIKALVTHDRDLDILADVMSLFAAPERKTVVESSEAYLRLSIPGKYQGPYNSSFVPYMREPMNLLESPYHNALIFMAPAQSAKTQSLVDCWIAHTAKISQCDMMVIQPTTRQANDYSATRLDRLFRYSPDLRSELAPGKSANTAYRKRYKKGHVLRLGWPSVPEVSGKSIKKMALPDYDRAPEDVGGNGSLWNLATPRTRVFGLDGMTLAESSPGYVVLDPKWDASSPHEAPPSKGIAALYNTGDRRRYYWPCSECHEYFEPGPGLKRVFIPPSGGIEERALGSRIWCPHCGAHNPTDAKKDQNLAGVWVPDFCFVDRDGHIHGDPPRTPRASFWLHGTQASFQSLDDMVYARLSAEAIFEQTGDETGLQATVNTNEGAPYLPEIMQSTRHLDHVMERREQMEKRIVPEGVRFLVASVDVQKNKFVIQVIGEGVRRERWIVDYFEIKYSPRGKDVKLDPAGYPEDWTPLVKHVINRRYPLADNSGRDMGIAQVVCDSGGSAGVTNNAYAFYQDILHDRHVDHGRFILLKGADQTGGARVKLSYPEISSQRQKHRYRAATRAATPLLLVNSNLMKDAALADLNRTEPGPGYVHFPLWLDKRYFQALVAEERDHLGKWQNPTNRRNEPWDLFYYCSVAALHQGVERVNWANPSQGWALPWDWNSMVASIAKNPTNTDKQENKHKSAKIERPVYNPTKPRGSWLNRDSSLWR